ncbi:hypothetical protein Glove_428g70 [Diversispora epigaea]|uniref:BACK domain-containing protein n=1 Tax=Diversispora epigaea TaxID=1348612 RepID=A0A397GZ33_9GLOM|nr:hypothetical protein Glove_428g70 [Diversispora epigaea]
MLAANEFELVELSKKLETLLIEIKAPWLRTHFSLVYHTIFNKQNFNYLEKFCNDIVAKYPNLIFDSSDFTSLSESALVSLLKRDDLQMEETKIWEYTIKWGNAQNSTLPMNLEEWSKENFLTLKTTLQQCLPYIRYFHIPGKDILDKIQPYKKIVDKQLWKDLMQYYLDPERPMKSVILPARSILVLTDGSAETTRGLGKHITEALTFDADDHGHQEKAAALIVVRSKTTFEKIKSIIMTQKDDGYFELNENVIKELDVPKIQVITTVQKYTTNGKLKKPESSSWWSTALTLSYLKNAASQHEGEWKEKYDKSQRYLSEQIGDEKAKKQLIDCTDKYVVDNIIKKVILEKKKTAVIAIQSATTPETIETVTSTQKKDGSFGISEKITEELDVTSPDDLITLAKNITTNDKLKSVDSSVWKTALILGYLNIAAPQHESSWGHKYRRAREYLHKKLNNPEVEEEIIKTSNKVIVEKTTKKINKSTTTPEIIKEVVSVQKKDGQIELSEAICKELDISPTKNIITIIQTYTKNEKLKKPESASWWSTAINLSYLKNAASEYENEWRDKYNQAREYLSWQIGDFETEKELLQATDKYVIDKITRNLFKNNW